MIKVQGRNDLTNVANTFKQSLEMLRDDMSNAIDGESENSPLFVNTEFIKKVSENVNGFIHDYALDVQSRFPTVVAAVGDYPNKEKTIGSLIKTMDTIINYKDIDISSKDPDDVDKVIDILEIIPTVEDLLIDIQQSRLANTINNPKTDPADKKFFQIIYNYNEYFSSMNLESSIQIAEAITCYIDYGESLLEALEMNENDENEYKLILLPGECYIKFTGKLLDKVLRAPVLGDLLDDGRLFLNRDNIMKNSHDIHKRIMYLK